MDYAIVLYFDKVSEERYSFLTVADEFGFTQENAPRFTAFATTNERLYWKRID